MKVVLLHGPAVNSSRKQLIILKSKFDNSNVVLFEEGSNISDMVGGMMTIPLISEPRLIILENPPEDFILSTLDSNDLTLIIWFDHEISFKKPIMEWVKKEKGEVLFFPEAREVSVFPLLDYLANKDNKAFLEIKKLKNAGYDIFYFITMTFYLLRNLVATPKTAQQFVKDKLIRQRKNFSLERLTNLYKEILEIDFKIKSGLLEKDQAEFLLVNKFTS